MPLKVPADVEPIRDARLTPIRLINTLKDRLIDGDGGLSAEVKRTMLDKNALFAESDEVIATLRRGSARGAIDPRDLYALVKSKKITLEQFLDCVKVEKTPLKKFLGEDQVDALSVKIDHPSPMLITEFKSGVTLDTSEASTAIARLARSVLGIKTGAAA